MNDPALDCEGDGLGAIARSQLAENIADVTLHGRLGYRKDRGHLFVAVTLCDELQHFKLTRGQVLTGYSFGKPVCYLGGNTAPAGMDGINRLEYLIAIHILKQISEGSRLQCPKNVFIAIIGR